MTNVVAEPSTHRRVGAATSRLSAASVDAMIAAVDVSISRQLDEILHHPAFQRLEETWRALWYVVRRVEPGQNVEVSFLPCSLDELRRDFAAATTLTECGLYRILQAEGFAGPDGRPYAAVMADFEMGPDPADVALLRRAAVVAEAVHAPFVAAASPCFLDPDAAVDGGPAFAELRAAGASRGAALVLPRVLARVPYQPDPAASFAYREGTPDHAAYLWGSAVPAFAGRLVESFVRYGWCANIIGREGGGAVDDLLTAVGPGREVVGPTEISVSERHADALSTRGLVVLEAAGGACFHSAPSLHAPRTFGDSEEGRAHEMSYRLGTELPYLFMTHRLAHYAKVVHAAHREVWADADHAASALGDFFSQFEIGREVLPAGQRNRRILRRFSIQVDGSADDAAWQRFVIKVRPHFKYHGAFFTLQVEGRLDTR